MVRIGRSCGFVHGNQSLSKENEHYLKISAVLEQAPLCKPKVYSVGLMSLETLSYVLLGRPLTI